MAKNGLLSSEKEQKNFEEYKDNVINQYKILIQDKPEYQKKTKVSLPLNVKYITSKDEAFIDKEIQKRVKIRQSSN